MSTTDFKRIHFYESFVRFHGHFYSGEGYMAVAEGAKAVLIRNDPGQIVVLVKSPEYIELASAMIAAERDLDLNDVNFEYKFLVGAFDIEAKFMFVA